MNNKLSTILAGTAILVLCPNLAQAISLDLVPSVENPSLGEKIEIEVQISELENGADPSLSTYDLNISFDDTMFQFNSATFGDPDLGNQLDLFGFGTETFVKERSPGIVNIFELSLDFPDVIDDLQAESFTLATLSFDTIAMGTSDFNLSIIDLGNAFGHPLEAEAGDSSISVTDEPTTVPEPSLSLLGFGLMIGIGALSKCSSIRSKNPQA